SQGVSTPSAPCGQLPSSYRPPTAVPDRQSPRPVRLARIPLPSPTRRARIGQATRKVHPMLSRRYLCLLFLGLALPACSRGGPGPAQVSAVQSDGVTRLAVDGRIIELKETAK